MSDGGPFAPAASFVRACEGCGRQVPLAEWQDGPLGCDDCRRRVVGVELRRGGLVVIECADELAATVVFNRYSAALARARGGFAAQLDERDRAA